MKNTLKKVTNLVLALCIIMTTCLMVPQTAMDVKAGSSIYFINKNGVVSYELGDRYSSYYALLSIMGCSKKSEIKKLKSSNSKICKVEACDGYIKAYFYDKKPGKVSISCTVKGVNLKTNLTIQNYSNPLKVLKYDGKDFRSKFNKTSTYNTTKKFSNKNFEIQTKNDWVIRSVSLYNSSKFKTYSVNGNKFKKKLSLTSDYSDITACCVNKKTGASEYITFNRRTYTY